MASRFVNDYNIYKKYLQNVVLLYKKRQDIRIYTELILSLVTVAVFGAFAIRPTINTILKLNSEIDTKRETIDKMDSKIENLIAAEDLYDREIDRVNILNNSIPEKPPVDNVIRQLEGIAQRSGAILTSLNIENVSILGRSVENKKSDKDADRFELPKDTKGYSLSIKIGGNYESLLSFMKDVENMRIPIYLQLSNIETVSIDKELPYDLLLTLEGDIAYMP